MPLQHDSSSFLPLAERFTTFGSSVRRNQNWNVRSRTFFFRFSFFSFSFLFAAVIDLLLGLLVPRDFFYGLNRGERFFSRKCDLKMKLESKTDCICVIYSLFSYFFFLGNTRQTYLSFFVCATTWKLRKN